MFLSQRKWFCFSHFCQEGTWNTRCGLYAVIFPYYARSLNNELLDTKCSIKKSLSGTSYLLRKVHAYILIKPFNVYIKTLHANLDNLISLTMLTWDFETRRRKNTCSVFVCPSPVEMQPLKTRWLGPRQTLKELCHDLRMCSVLGCSADFLNFPPYWI